VNKDEYNRMKISDNLVEEMLVLRI